MHSEPVGAGISTMPRSGPTISSDATIARIASPTLFVFIFVAFFLVVPLLLTLTIILVVATTPGQLPTLDCLYPNLTPPSTRRSQEVKEGQWSVSGISISHFISAMKDWKGAPVIVISARNLYKLTSSDLGERRGMDSMQSH